jgi:hypothetical protein
MAESAVQNSMFVIGKKAALERDEFKSSTTPGLAASWFPGFLVSGPRNSRYIGDRTLDSKLCKDIYQTESVRKSTATIEKITPPTKRDLGGVTVYLAEVTFRLDEHDLESAATQVCFDELDKVLSVSHVTGRPWQPDLSKSVYPVENGVFVATLPADPGWEIGKTFNVLLPNISE